MKVLCQSLATNMMSELRKIDTNEIKNVSGKMVRVHRLLNWGDYSGMVKQITGKAHILRFSVNKMSIHVLSECSNITIHIRDMDKISH